MAIKIFCPTKFLIKIHYSTPTWKIENKIREKKNLNKELVHRHELARHAINGSLWTTGLGMVIDPVCIKRPKIGLLELGKPIQPIEVLAFQK